ncbi:MAG: capsular polysaccharide synthesis protein [Akkermansia sp.]|nr:capsular polysaccharide synthesis protein [Akkermansia sp.]
MKKLSKKIWHFYTFFRDMDWEYIIPCLFAHLKYRDPIRRGKAKRGLKQAFLERRFSHILEKYKSAVSSGQENTGPIWVCWLQGEENMPHIVKRCYERLKLMAPKGRDVVLLHMGNIAQYVQLPECIYEKLRKGRISYIHFSDVLRMSLLAERGGIWIDSTIYVHSPIPESIFTKPYFSVRTVFDFDYLGANRCLWKCFLMGAAAHSPWFCCAAEMKQEYWKTMDFAVDYLIMDHLLLAAYDHNEDAQNGVDAGVELAPHILGFEKIANEPCDEEKFRKMCEECRWFKLSYKLPFKEYTEDGLLTYYGRLVSAE